MSNSSDGEGSLLRRRSNNGQGNTPAASAANVGRGERQLPICTKIEEALYKAAELEHVPLSEGADELIYQNNCKQ